MMELSLGEYEGALAHLARACAAEIGSDTTRQLLDEAFMVSGQLEGRRALWRTIRDSWGYEGGGTSTLRMNNGWSG